MILKIWPELEEMPIAIRQFLTTEAKYQFYLIRQNDDIKLFKQYETLTIPENINYNSIESLSNEVKEKLGLARPLNIGAASRISGVTPAALIALIVYLRKEHAL